MSSGPNDPNLQVEMKVVADTAGAKATREEFDKTTESAKRLSDETKKSHDTIDSSWKKIRQNIKDTHGALGDLISNFASSAKHLSAGFAIGIAIEGVMALARAFKDGFAGTIIPTLEMFTSKFNRSLEKFADSKKVMEGLAGQQALFTQALKATNDALDDQIAKIDQKLARDQKLLEAQHKKDAAEAEAETDPVKRAQRVANVEAGFAMGQSRLAGGSTAAKRAAISKAIAGLDVDQSEIADAQINPDKARAQFAAAQAAQERLARAQGIGAQLGAQISEQQKLTNPSGNSNVNSEWWTGAGFRYLWARLLESKKFNELDPSDESISPEYTKQSGKFQRVEAGMRERRLREELGINISEVQRAAADARSLRGDLPAKIGTKDQLEDFLRSSETEGAKGFEAIELRRRELLKRKAELEEDAGNEKAVGNLDQRGAKFKAQRSIEDAARQEAKEFYQQQQRWEIEQNRENEAGKRILLNPQGASINQPGLDNLAALPDTLIRLNAALGPVLDKLNSRIDDLSRV